MYANRFDADDRRHRLATLFIMFLLLIASGLIGKRFLAGYAAIVLCYAGAKYVIATMYFVAGHRHRESAGLTTRVGAVILAGTTISLASVLFAPPLRYDVFYLGIVFDLAAFVFLLRRPLAAIPVHSGHLVERVGLLTMIMLGQSISSLATGFADIAWSAEKLAAATTGFVMVAGIWWVYFDSAGLLSERRLSTGHAILYSHLFVFIGLSVLASLVRHAVLDDLRASEFRVLAAIGAVCFFMGKQYAYFKERPELRRRLVLNTLAVFVLGGCALLLPATDDILMGLTAAVICYAVLSLAYQQIQPDQRERPAPS